MTTEVQTEQDVPIKRLSGMFGDMKSADQKTFDYIETYEVNSVTTYLKFLARLPSPKTLLTLYLGNNMMIVAWCEGCDIRRLGAPLSGGRIQFTLTYNLSRPTKEDEANAEKPPWNYPVNDLSIDAVTEDISAEYYYPKNSLVPERFVNTAGVMLEAAGKVGMLQISFSYNVLEYDPNTAWRLISTVNAFPVKVVGYNFLQRELLLEKITAKEVKTYSTNEEGTETLKWSYWNVSVQFLANPRTWDKKYLNVGTHLLNASGTGLEQIWRWNNESCAVYGSYSNYRSAVLGGLAYDGEAVSEPMFLSSNGKVINGFYDGKQIPSYIEGSLFYPADWSALDIPKSLSWR